MLFSSSTNYAIRAILYLAMKSSEKEKMGIREVADALNMPYHYLGKILQQMAAHGIIESSKGPNGGFYLPPSLLSMPMIRVVDLFESPDLFKKCGLGLRACSDEQPCPVHHHFKAFRDHLYQNLQNQSIRDWCEAIENGEAVLTLE